MRWFLRAIAVVAVLAAGLGNAQQNASRFALVIGNAAYQTPGWQLVNPVNDANLMATRLRALGFHVVPLMNATKAQMEGAMNAFTARVSASGGEAVGVFYYAGHGVEHDGANLLVPVDVTARSMDELRYQAPPMQFLLRDMARAGNKVNVIILDACRNLPLPAGSRTGPAGGLADLADVPDNVLIAYATRPGLTAPDNPAERNSVFTRTLSEALARNPSDTAVNLFSQVQAQVFSATGRLQRPEFRSGLLRAPDWRFAAAPAVAAPTVDPELGRLRRENEALRQKEQEKLRNGAPTSTPTVAVQPPRAQSGQTIKDCPECPEIVVVPAGSFRIGAEFIEAHNQNEGPPTTVHIRAFGIGKFEVTRGEWAAFVAATRRSNPANDCVTLKTGNYAPSGSWRDPGFPQTDRHPVTCISWSDAQAYAVWLSRRTGRSYRLPTESEWEYAARAGSTTPYWWGTSISPRHGNYTDSGVLGTSPVGEYAPNPFGLHDTAGNASEWTEDCYEVSHARRPVDGSAFQGGSLCGQRTYRGGDWHTGGVVLRSAYRAGSGPAARHHGSGLRVVRDLAP